MKKGLRCTQGGSKEESRRVKMNEKRLMEQNKIGHLVIYVWTWRLRRKERVLTWVLRWKERKCVVAYDRK